MRYLCYSGFYGVLLSILDTSDYEKLAVRDRKLAEIGKNQFNIFYSVTVPLDMIIKMYIYSQLQISGSDRSLLNALREITTMASRINLPKTITVSISFVFFFCYTPSLITSAYKQTT